MGDLLEQATTYLACPEDKLKLDIHLSDAFNGIYQCQNCGRQYPIVDGVPVFYTNGSLSGVYDEDRLTDSIRRNVTTGEPIAGSVDQLLELYLQKDETKSAIIRLIDTLSQIGEGLPDTAISLLQQEGTRARYNVESYRGTFLLPDKLLSEISNTGIILETATGPGENLIYLRKEGFRNPMVGLDISLSMVRCLMQESQRQGLDILAIQGDASALPLRDNVVETAMQFNAFDRIAMLRKMAMETGRVLSQTGLVIYGSCEPPQYEYTKDGIRIVYVPKDQRITPDDAIRIAGRVTTFFQDFPWDIATLLDGEENLTTRVYVGKL